jgi:hypothetical protein
MATFISGDSGSLYHECEVLSIRPGLLSPFAELRQILSLAKMMTDFEINSLRTGL